MTVGIVAFPKDALVLFRGKVRIVIIVRGGKLSLSGQINHKDAGVLSVAFIGCPPGDGGTSLA